MPSSKKPSWFLQNSLNEAKALEDAKAEADVLDQIAQTYAMWGDQQKALENWQQAVEVLSRAGSPTDLLKKKIGDVYLELGKVDEASQYVKDG